MSIQFNKDDLEVKAALKKIQVSAPDLKPGIMDTINNKPICNKKWSFAIISCAIAILVAGTAYALNYSSFTKLLTDVNPKFSSVLSPVELSCVNDGIKMEVVAVACFDNYMQTFLTLTDLTDQNRLSGLRSHMDFLSVTGVTGLSTSSQPLYTDPETGVVTISFEAESNTGFEGKELTVKVRDLHTNDRLYEGHDFGIESASMISEGISDTIELKDDLEYVLRGERSVSEKKPESINFLTPNANSIRFLDIDDFKISNYGVVDGTFRVQTWHDYYHTGITSSLYLKNDRGEIIESGDPVLSFGIDENGSLTAHTNEYWEYEFHLPLNELENYTLLGDIGYSDRYPGYWEVTFTSEKSIGQTLTKAFNHQINEFQIKELIITPLGINFTGEKDEVYEGTAFGGFDTEITVRTKEDTITLNHRYSSFDTEINPVKEVSFWKAERPINIDTIKSVIINGEEYPL